MIRPPTRKAGRPGGPATGGERRAGAEDRNRKAGAHPPEKIDWIARNRRDSSRNLSPESITTQSGIRSSDRTPQGGSTCRGGSSRSQAVFNSTLADGLTLTLASAGLAPAMSNRMGPPVRRGAMREPPSGVAPPSFPGPRDPLRAGGHDLGAPSRVAGRDGGNAPGDRSLRGDAGAGPEGHPACMGARAEQARVRWHQIRGAAVRLDHPTEVNASFTVPETDDPLGFLLVVANDRGIDSAEISVPCSRADGPAAPGGSRADAGDDRLGLVGREITLNGMRSEPRGHLAYRWVQTGGPIVRLKIEEGYVYSFVPTVPGSYRFALVVAASGEISEPDEVSVTVGTGARGGAVRGDAAAADPLPTQELARAGLKGLKLGADVAEPLARVFEDTADRMDLYENYADAFAEMSRRLEPILPEDPSQRMHAGSATLRTVDRPGRRGHAERGPGFPLAREPDGPAQRKSEGHTCRPISFDRRGAQIGGGVPLSAARPDSTARAATRGLGISTGSKGKALMGHGCWRRSAWVPRCSTLGICGYSSEPCSGQQVHPEPAKVRGDGLRWPAPLNITRRPARVYRPW